MSKLRSAVLFTKQEDCTVQPLFMQVSLSLSHSLQCCLLFGIAVLSVAICVCAF